MPMQVFPRRRRIKFARRSTAALVSEIEILGKFPKARVRVARHLQRLHA